MKAEKIEACQATFIYANFKVVFRYWWAHTEALMGSDMVVFFDPAIDCGLGLAGQTNGTTMQV